MWTWIPSLLLASPGFVDSTDGCHSSIRRAGDVNGDGVPDPLVSSASVEDAGRVLVFSGKDGSLLIELSGDRSGDGFGCDMASVGDVDGDGRPDFIVGAMGSRPSNTLRGYARVHSGKDGRLLHRFSDEGRNRLGAAGGAAGDVDGDGVPDLLVGAPGRASNVAGFVRVHSGKDGSLILQVDSDRGSRTKKEKFIDLFGASVAGCGDLDGDGHADFVVGNSGGDPTRSSAGLLVAYSGRDGKVIFTALGQASDMEYGWTCGPAGDVDGDGTPDVLVSALDTYVGILSGKSGAELPAWTTRRKAAVLDSYGSTFDALGDVDGDGVPDVVVGANESWKEMFDHGFANVLSGKGGQVLHHFGFFDYGVDACGLGDVDGDGVPDLGLSAPLRRRVRVFSGKDFSELRAIHWEAPEETPARPAPDTPR